MKGRLQELDIQLTLLQPEKVVSSVYPRLESSVWWAHPEMLLQTLLCSAHEADRTFAVKKVLEVRAMEVERSPVRASHKVSLNKDATCLQNLIVWDPMKTNEPVLTHQLSEEDLKMIVQTPMEVGLYPVHGQGVERCVREVTAALEAVFGQDRRDWLVKRGWPTGRGGEMP